MPEEFGKCMRELRRDGAPTGYTEVLAFLDKWIWPRNIRMDLRKIFHAMANTSDLEAQYFNCSASELLTVAPVLNLCFATIAAAQGYCTACVTSLCACLDVVELLVTMKNATVPALLRAAVTRHVTSRSGVWHRHRRETNEAAHDPTLGRHMPESVGALYSRWVRSTLGLARTPRVTSAVSCRTLQSNNAKP